MGRHASSEYCGPSWDEILPTPHFMTQEASVASSSNKRIMQEAPAMGILQIDGHTRRNPSRGGSGCTVTCPRRAPRLVEERRRLTSPF